MKRLLSLLAPAGPRGRLSVLIFHRVLPRPDELCPDEMHAARFDALCSWLAGTFSVLPLAEGVVRLRTGTLPARALAITFDDGYADNHEVALPILQRHGLHATFFIATGFLDGGRMFNDTVIEAVRRAPGPMLNLSDPEAGELGCLPVGDVAQRRAAVDTILAGIKYRPIAQRQVVADAIAARVAGAGGGEPPRNLMMRSEQVAALARAGMGIGGHTVNHPILAGLDAETARLEIREGRRTLQTITGHPVTLFAYPNGRPGIDYDAASIALVRDAGFEAAVSTAWGVASVQSDPFQLPRFTPWAQSPRRFAAHMVRNYWRQPQTAAA